METFYSELDNQTQNIYQIVYDQPNKLQRNLNFNYPQLYSSYLMVFHKMHLTIKET